MFYKKILIIVFVLISYIGHSQINIKAFITNSNNTPIPYVNVYIKNTNIGTISNDDGYFEIKIPEQYIENIVVISYIILLYSLLVKGDDNSDRKLVLVAREKGFI